MRDEFGINTYFNSSAQKYAGESFLSAEGFMYNDDPDWGAKPLVSKGDVLVELNDKRKVEMNRIIDALIF